MPNITIIAGCLLIILGLAGYFGTGGESITALIPTFFGVVIAALGFLGKKENIHKHVMHVALLIALLGLIGSFAGIPKAVSMLGGEEIARPAAAMAQAVMSLICAVYLIFGIQSFIKTRRDRKMPK